MSPDGIDAGRGESPAASPATSHDATHDARSDAPTDAHVEPSFEVLRAITRQMATAESLEAVLQSIVSSLVERAGATVARVFLVLRNDECEQCRAEAEAIRARGQVPPPAEEKALHLLAHAGAETDPPEVFHRVPIASFLPPAILLRSRTPTLLEDWRTPVPFKRDPRVEAAWTQLGITSVTGYPLYFRDEPVGVIGFLSRDRISRHQFELLGIFADQAAMAIRNAQLFRDRERAKERLQDENAYLQDELRLDQGFEGIVGTSAAMRAVLRQVRQVAGVGTTVLLTGETGTGKELLARALHAGSPRHTRALIKLNCGAIPAGVVESELFGHEKGAFTGALQRRLGRFELADQGTLFLDEVGELPLETQVKLLRVLQEKELERVGGSGRPIPVDVRLVAATHRDLSREVAHGRFRADLFYRLNVFPIRVPPLRERPEDLGPLVQHFLAQFQRKLGKPLRSLAPASQAALERYPWPGNIRELQNVLERACVLATGPVVELPDTLRARPARVAASSSEEPIPTLAEHERRTIRRALAAVQGRVYGPGGAAALLGVNPSTLRSRMQKLGITRTS